MITLKKDLIISNELFRKMQSGEMKLEETKRLQNKFKSNLKEISRGRFKSKQQKRALENI